MTARRLLLLALALLGFGALLGEGWRAWRFYEDVTAARATLVALRDDLTLATLESSEADVEQLQSQLLQASRGLSQAGSFVRNDPLLAAASRLPVLGPNARAVRHLVEAADASARTGLLASEVLLAFHRSEAVPGNTSLQDAVAFLREQEEQMRSVREGLVTMQRSAARVPDGLVPPLQRARADLLTAVARLDGMVTGYERANAFLPPLLGYEGAKSYLVLPQNDTELFPSGGLISSYGVASFDQGRLASMQFEYFVNLFDRWQTLSGGEYVAPPEPLRNYLLRHVSWGLGEAGWFPDFPTTANLARGFVEKGGVPPTDGTIAIDLQFVAALLDYLGPVRVPAYGVTVDAANLSEITLEQTRNESAVPGSPGKAFLAGLGQALLAEVFSAPRQKWAGLLEVMDRMARERHLQMHFSDPALQELSEAYGLDGRLLQPPGDFLMLADTSVQSTKLNLILRTAVRVELRLLPDGAALTRVRYSLQNPFPEWRHGRNSAMVKALMLDGVYGCYLRLYAGPRAQLEQVSLDGVPAGVEQAGLELGRMAFGRFFPVLPGETRQIEFTYRTLEAVRRDNTRSHYSLYVQKQPGTRATPLELSIALPPGAQDVVLKLDGTEIERSDSIRTDLRVDRVIEVSYRGGRSRP